MNNTVYDDLDTELDFFILKNIYLDLCFKIANNEKMEYDVNYIYLSTIPDFIENNEEKFVNHKSDEYQTFINTKIEHYINNKNEYNHKPSIIILLKIINLFDNEQEDNELIILYNRLLHMINYFHPYALFINEEYIKENNQYKVITRRTVKESTIIQVYNNLPLLEDFNRFIKKIFQQERTDYDLLLNEFEHIDKVNLNDNKYNNLKFNIFIAALHQFIVINPEPLDLTYFFDEENIPNSNSIKFSIYMAWYIYQKVHNNYRKTVDIPSLDLNINKFYAYLIMINNDVLKKMLRHISETDYKPNNNFNIDELFDNGKFIENKYDYNYIQTEYIAFKPQENILREQLVYNGGGKLLLPISPLGMIYKYLSKF
jgi:hypothetical protein